MASVEKPAICGICPGGCGIVATVAEGKLVGVKGATGTPFGSLCVRGKAAVEVLYSPDRLETPLIRVGKKGEGEFDMSFSPALMALLSEPVVPPSDDSLLVRVNFRND